MQLCVTEQNPINLLTQPIQLIKAIKQLVQFMQLIQKRKLQLSQLNHVTQQNSYKSPQPMFHFDLFINHRQIDLRKTTLRDACASLSFIFC